MKITVDIDASTLEGKQIIEYLKDFPEVVTFENELLNESQQEYITKPTSAFIPFEGYVSAEEFRVEAKKRAKLRQKKEEKKLSKAGEWLRSGKSIIASYDMRAVLK